MGGSSSKPKKDDWTSFKERLYNNVSDEIAKRAMLQREVQMSVNIAKARDTLQIFGPLWLTLTTVVTTAAIAKKPVPQIAFVPVVVGGIALANMADMAYGNKLQRVTKEAEYIMEHEQYRFVAPKQAPFAKFYTDEQKEVLWNEATPVGQLFPSSVVFPREKK